MKIHKNQSLLIVVFFSKMTTEWLPLTGHLIILYCIYKCFLKNSIAFGKLYIFGHYRKKIAAEGCKSRNIHSLTIEFKYKSHNKKKFSITL